MKNVIFIFCLAIVGLVACQNESTNTTTANADTNGINTTTDEVEVDVKESPLGETDYKVFPPPLSGATSTPQVDKVNRILTTNYWVNTAYFHKSVEGSNRANQGNWYQFRPDGTFTFGHMSDELTKGNWSFAYKGDTGQVHLQAEDKKYSGKWNIKIGSTADIMIWVGTEVYRTNGIQQRFENLMFIPKNRKELGLKE